VKLARPDLAAYVVVALVVLAVTVLSALHASIPEVLPYIAVGALGVGGGVSMQGASSTSTSSTSTSAPAAPQQTMAPQALTADPATGVFPRIASHAP
jgi:hypothetical protein